LLPAVVQSIPNRSDLEIVFAALTTGGIRSADATAMATAHDLIFVISTS
jgi:hypothetical protein